MPRKDRSKRKAWEKKLAAFKESNLSGPKWCRENKENYYQFNYWKKTLKTSNNTLHFEELKEETPKQASIELRLGDLTITFPNGCHPELLELCVKVLRKIDVSH